MRTTFALDTLLPKTRQAILASTLMQLDRWWYLTDLARRLDRRPSSLQRELAALTAAGILISKRDGNRVYYRANVACPFFHDLRGLLMKTAGLVDVLRRSLEPTEKSIDWAFVYGSAADSREHSASDVDLMIVGNVSLAALAPVLQKAERHLNRPVNPTIYSHEEFAKKVKSGHHFLRAVLKGRKIFICGDARDLAKAFGRRWRRAGRDSSSRSGAS